MSNTKSLYDTTLKRVNNFLQLSGCHFNQLHVNLNSRDGFISRWFYWFNILWIFTHIFGEVVWLVCEYKTESIVKLTYLIPCITLSSLGCAKSIFLVLNSNHVIDLITSIKKLQAITLKHDFDGNVKKAIKKSTTILLIYININVFLYTFGLILFSVGPLFLTWVIYKSTGNLVMQLPFLSKYPFDETNIRYWPLAYIHQIWSGFIATSTVHGVDSFYSLSCTFLQIQFKILHYDIGRLLSPSYGGTTGNSDVEFKERFVKIIERHEYLIRCVDIIEKVYSKSNLCNIAVLPIVMCVSTFNIAQIDGFFLKTPFIAFLVMWLMQGFFLCYYSDILKQSSTEISEAVYKSMWYKADTRIMKDLKFVLMRAQKPCKLTASGFTDLNIKVFTKTVSTAWSYFALLQTMYTK